MTWTENQLNGQALRVVISGTKSTWRQVTGGVPGGLLLGPTPFKAFVSDPGVVSQCTLNKLVANRERGAVTAPHSGCAAMQRAWTGWGIGLPGILGGSTSEPAGLGLGDKESHAPPLRARGQPAGKQLCVQRKALGCWWTQADHASSTPSWQRRPAAAWAELGGVLSADQGR